MSKKLSTQEKARRMWVRALRSGKYGWGKDLLQPDDNKFCCLGVLCNLAVKQGVITKYVKNNGTLSSYPKVKRWVGLLDDAGKFGKGCLAQINDGSARNPLKKIANLIDKKPEGLFSNEVVR
jgi:hypothetical protein